MDKEQTIRKMDSALIDLVTAGEVIERPASVIKELIENSIDAQAKAIRVEIRRGGVASVKVTDNGHGMSRADLGMCLKNHATSKIAKVDDLFQIRQMGFRGEALPSIAAVAHLRISTRRPQDVEGSLLEAHGGQEDEICAAGCPPGTEIEMRELFYNIPVRRKFLKGPDTEAGHIEHQIKLYALAYPEIRFTYLRDGQVVFDMAATHDHRQRIAECTKREFAEGLLRMCPVNAPGIHVEGFLTPLSEAQNSKNLQFVFLNGRPIRDKVVMRAVRDGFGGNVKGLHPGLIMFMEVEPALVDVNVHPTKQEVRFMRQTDVTTAIIDAIAGTLSAHSRGLSTPCAPPQPPPAPQPHSPRAAAPAPAAPQSPPPHAAEALARPAQAPATRTLSSPPYRTLTPQAIPPHPTPARLQLITEPRQDSLPLPPDEQEGPAPTGDNFELLGVIRHRYILFENAEGLVLVSVRAARERIVFEQVMVSEREQVVSQALLQACMVELDVRKSELVRKLHPLFVQAGFRITEFGQRTLRIEAIPPYLQPSEIQGFVTEFIEEYTEGDARLLNRGNAFQPFAMRMAQEYVKRENVDYWLAHPRTLLSELRNCENPYCTPHGKPTMIPFTINEIRRKFRM